MKLEVLKKRVNVLEKLYSQVDKSSFKELTGFIGRFFKTYSLFQTREQYKIANVDIPAKLKLFFNQYDSELDSLSQRIINLADSMEREFQKFRSSESPSPVGNCYSFFDPSNSNGEVSSTNTHQNGMS